MTVKSAPRRRPGTTASAPSGVTPAEREHYRALYAAGRFAELLASVDRALARLPGDFDMLNHRAVALRRLGRLELAVECCIEAARADPASLVPIVNLGNLYVDLRDGVRGAAVFGELVRRQPQSVEFRRMLGVSCRHAGDLASAEQHLRVAIALDPAEMRPLLDLALLLEEQGRLDDAERLYAEAHGAQADSIELVEAQAGFLRRRGRVGEAVTLLEARIARGAGALGALHYQLGRTLGPIDRERANAELRRAVELEPGHPAYLIELAESLDRTRGPGEGEHIAEAYRIARQRLALGGDLLRDARALRAILNRAADYEASAQVGAIAVLGPHWARTGQEAALHTLLGQVQSAEERRALVAYHRDWGRGIEPIAARTPLQRSARPANAVRIRIGFMSSDLRNHPVAYFAAPLLIGLDRSRFEIFCYAWNTGPVDPVQQAIAGRVDAFRHHPAAGDREAAQIIADDALDVLFELGGSTDMNRIRAMAWKPAPRQASWLGYPHSCGLGAIDRILTDPFLMPPDPALLIERPLQLAHSWVAFRQPGFGPVTPIEPLTPQERTGRVTFGTMNNPAKYNPNLLRTWAEVLRRVPGSHFLFVRPEGASEGFRSNVRAAFAAAGVDPERVEFLPVRGTHLQHYNRIDVALDSFPQTGGTTTCETLWMGVPVATLVGEAFFERLSYSNLHNAGLGAHCASNVPQYIEIAVALAQATDWRREFRAKARDWLAAHPLGRPDQFVQDFTTAVLAWMDESPSRSATAALSAESSRQGALR